MDRADEGSEPYPRQGKSVSTFEAQPIRGKFTGEQPKKTAVIQPRYEGQSSCRLYLANRNDPPLIINEVEADPTCPF